MMRRPGRAARRPTHICACSAMRRELAENSSGSSGAACRLDTRRASARSPMGRRQAPRGGRTGGASRSANLGQVAAALRVRRHRCRRRESARCATGRQRRLSVRGLDRIADWRDAVGGAVARFKPVESDAWQAELAGRTTPIAPNSCGGGDHRQPAAVRRAPDAGRISARPAEQVKPASSVTHSQLNREPTTRHDVPGKSRRDSSAFTHRPSSKLHSKRFCGAGSCGSDHRL